MATVQAVALQASASALALGLYSVTSARLNSSQAVASYVPFSKLRCKPESSRAGWKVPSSSSQSCHCAASEQSQPQADSKLKPEMVRRCSPRETRLRSVAAGFLPALVLAFVEADLPQGIVTETVVHDFMISEVFLKTFYMVFICVFSWGAVLFASMNDPYYDSDEYRDAGGNGTQHWIYTRAEEDEQVAREELWREELRREIEDKLGDVKELEAPEGEKEKTLV